MKQKKNDKHTRKSPLYGTSAWGWRAPRRTGAVQLSQEKEREHAADAREVHRWPMEKNETSLEQIPRNANCPTRGVTGTKNNKYNEGRKRPLGPFGVEPRLNKTAPWGAKK